MMQVVKTPSQEATLLSRRPPLNSTTLPVDVWIGRRPLDRFKSERFIAKWESNGLLLGRNCKPFFN